MLNFMSLIYIRLKPNKIDLGSTFVKSSTTMINFSSGHMEQTNYLIMHTAFILNPFNPFKPNGIYLYYQFEKSISVLRVVRLYFPFLSKF